MAILFALLACAATRPAVPSRPVAAELRSVLASEGPIESRLAPPDDADLAIFYLGEQKGSLDPCGCPGRPRGGVARAHAYVDAARRPEDIVVNGGGFLEDAMGLDGNPRPEVPVMNRYAAMGLARVGFDAMNVGYVDLAGMTPDMGLPLVSANAPLAETSRVVVRGELRVGVTGITGRGVSFVPTAAIDDPLEAGRAVLRHLRKRADLVVLLSYRATDVARTLAREGLADVVVDTNLHSTFDEPMRVGHAVWVRSSLETMQLGELRLTLRDGRITKAVDRKIDLDAEIRGDAKDEALALEARREINDAR